MTKKQMKKMAKRLAELEHAVQILSDEVEVQRAKEEIIRINDSADFTIEEMLELDELIAKELEKI